MQRFFLGTGTSQVRVRFRTEGLSGRPRDDTVTQEGVSSGSIERRDTTGTFFSACGGELTHFELQGSESDPFLATRNRADLETRGFVVSLVP